MVKISPDSNEINVEMIKKISFLFIAFICFLSCTNIVPVIMENEIYYKNGIETKSYSSFSDSLDLGNYPYSIEEDSLFLEALHGKIVSIVDRNEYYVINDEFIYFKCELQNRVAGSTSRMYGNLLHESAQHIYLSLNCGFDSFMMGYENELSIFKEAVDEWNNLNNCNIFFALSDDYNYYGNPYNWYAVNVYIDDQVAIYGDQEQYLQENNMNYLWGGTHSNVPYQNLWINVENSTYKNFDNQTKKYLMMHALGHLVRLQDFELGHDWFAGTSTGDIYSIMYSYSYLYQWGMSWSGFSRIDEEDLAYIYPLKPSSVDYTFVPNQTSNQLEIDKEYTIVSMVESLKSLNDCSYEYEISAEAESYEYTVVNDTLKIKFYNSGTYYITLNLKLKSGLVFSCTKEFNVIGESIVLPSESEIVVGQEFTINWLCKENQSVTYTAIETIFDNSDKNISITMLSSSEASILIKDYGSYIITMRKKGNNGNIIQTRTFYIDRFYRPEMSFPDYFGTIDVFDYRQNVFEIGRECPEDVSDIIITGLNPPYTIMVGDGGALQERLYVKQYAKFYRDAFLPPFRVDRGPVTAISTGVERTFLKGISGIIQIPAGRNGYISVPEPGWLNYTGYYAIIIPEDRVYLR